MKKIEEYIPECCETCFFRISGAITGRCDNCEKCSKYAITNRTEEFEEAIKAAVADAIDDFAKKVKAKHYTYGNEENGYYSVHAISERDIDEMAEELKKGMEE